MMIRHELPSKIGLREQLEQALVRGQIDRRTFLRFAAAAGLGGAALATWADELDAIRANQAERAARLLPQYDYIVCGAGSGACALVGRLAKNTSASILVLEAGGWDTDKAVLDPRLWFTNLGTERDWGDVAVASPGTRGRAIGEHMGRVVGGGSSINATIWARPHKEDWAHWVEATGDTRWSHERALTIFKRMENWQGKADEHYRGRGGPVWVEPSQNPHPLAPAMLESCRSLGLTVYDDLNGKREESDGGFALMNHIIREGQRVNLARAYLYPVMAQPNVTVLTGAHVDRVLFEKDRAIGIEYRRGGRQDTVRASREVVLCAGGVRTPQLLMLSGIGDEKALKAIGVRRHVHSPEVGRNFQDHLLHGGCIWESPVPVDYRNSGAECSGFWKSDSSVKVPDMNLVQIELPYASDVVAKDYAVPSNAWAICAGLVAPKSRGVLTLRSADPSALPEIQANFLSHPDDVRIYAKAIEMCREIGNSAPMKPFIKREVVPGKKLNTKEMEVLARDGATTFFHISGTARMGKDRHAVVDSQLRVNGVRGLRIADSSIMPRIVSVATMPTCALIGEQAADLIAAG